MTWQELIMITDNIENDYLDWNNLIKYNPDYILLDEEDLPEDDDDNTLKDAVVHVAETLLLSSIGLSAPPTDLPSELYIWYAKAVFAQVEYFLANGVEEEADVKFSIGSYSDSGGTTYGSILTKKAQNFIRNTGLLYTGLCGSGEIHYE